MSLPRWHNVPLSSLVVAEPGWRRDDPVMLEKLRASLRRHGQLRAVVVRTVAGRHEVVDGRKLVAAMRGLGYESATVVNVGDIDTESAVRMSFDLDLCFETDFARLSSAVAGMVAAGATPDSLAATSCFDAERIGYMVKLASNFDWSQFSSAPKEQGNLWDDPVQLQEPLGEPDVQPALDIQPVGPPPDDGLLF